MKPRRLRQETETFAPHALQRVEVAGPRLNFRHALMVFLPQLGQASMLRDQVRVMVGGGGEVCGLMLSVRQECQQSEASSGSALADLLGVTSTESPRNQ